MEISLIYIIVFIAGAVFGFAVFKFLQNREKSMFCDMSNVKDELLQTVKKDFSQIALETLNKEQDTLLRKNQEAVNVTLAPLNKQLTDFKTDIERYKYEHTKNTGELKSQMEGIVKNSTKLSESAQNLTDALTKNRNVKGWYGEDLAKTILEKSGLVEGVHFACQNYSQAENKDNEIKNVKPDFVIYLSNNRNLVIDAKAILSSSLIENDENISADDILSAVKVRVKELAQKKYENIEGLHQPEFVLMYIPIEPVVNLLYTSKQGMDLVEFAKQNNIIITGSVSLVAIIKLVNWMWHESERIKNLDKIVETGRKLYDAMALHAQELLEIQSAISKAKDKTDETIKRMIDNPRTKINVFKEAQKLAEYGITGSSREIEDKFLDGMEIEAIEMKVIDSTRKKAAKAGKSSEN